MVGEFPDLQGQIGRRYALAKGEPPEVADAIADHYLPRGASDVVSPSVAGSIVGLADRIDTLVGGFIAGLAPTGSADAFGLRRAALGVVRTLLQREWRISLRDLLYFAGEPLTQDENQLGDVYNFLALRLKGFLTETQGIPSDCVEAVFGVGFDDIVDARDRAVALGKLRARADFEPLGAAFKRVANILRGQAIDRAPDPAGFVEGEEKALWSSFGDIEGRVAIRLKDGDYGGALQVLAELKGPVDRFFDKVLVMDKDERVKANRLALLGRINATFTRIADFRQLSV
jgi:glycyl-tRNA synthetase beta chain